MESQADDIDVENLFNEENLNNAALGGGILSENAILHDPVFGTFPGQSNFLSDLAVNGSLPQLTWAKPGVIARISADGGLVEMSVQRYDAKTGSWALTRPLPLDATFEDAVSLAWNMNGNELAVLDRKGRANIFNLYNNALNKYHHSRDGIEDPADESNRPIGMIWLTLSRGEADKKKTVLENVKENGRWKHEHIEGGYYPPHLLRSMCIVNRMGVVTLLSTKDASPLESSIVALPVASPSATFTHAAIAQTPEGRLIVALHEAGTGEISAYYVDIIPQPKESPTLSAELIDRHLSAGPPYLSVDNAMIGDLGEGCILTHLHILPECEYSWDHLTKPHLRGKQPATLIAVYSSYNEQRNAAGDNFFGSTVVKRWHFKTSDMELHPRFGAPSAKVGPVTVLQPLPDTVMPAPITNLQVIEPGNINATTSVDGATVFWDSTTMTPATPDPESQIVSSVGSVNLDYPHLTRSITQCMSPHAMVLAQIDQQGKLELQMPKYRDYSNTNPNPASRHDLDPNNPVDDALIAGYILSFSRSCWNANTTFDDIVASIHGTISPTSLVHVRRQLFMTLFHPKNLVPGPSNVSEVDKVPHSLIITKALAFQFGLFNRQPTATKEERTAHLWTWMVLNLRWSITVLGDTYKSMHQPAPGRNPAALNPLRGQFPPSFLDMVCHNIRWVFALYNYIIQSILTIADRKSHADFFLEANAGDIAGDGRQGVLALLLNHSWSRSFLTIMSRLMKACAQKGGVIINFNSSKPLQSPVSPQLAGTTLGRIALTIQTCCLQHGITVNALEALFDAKTHPDNWGSDEENWECFRRQVEMMVTGKVPRQYDGTIQKMLDKCISGAEGLRATGEIDRLRLMEEMPDLGYVFLNMDDIAFAEHRPQMCVDAYDLVNGPTGGSNATEVWGRSMNGDKKTNGAKAGGTRVLYDAHKKLPLFSQQSSAINAVGAAGMNSSLPRVKTTAELLAAQVRRCVRCGSLSDNHVDPVSRLAQGNWPRPLMSLMNKCVCEGSWVIEGVAEGLHV